MTRVVFVVFLMGIALSSGAEQWTLKPLIDGTKPLTPDVLFEGAKNGLPAWPSFADKPGWVSLNYLRSLWSFSPETIVVGNGAVWLPPQGLAKNEKNFVYRLVLFLKQNLLKQPREQNLYDPHQISFFFDHFNLPANLPDEPQFELLFPSFHNGVLSGRQQIRLMQAGEASVSQTFSFFLKTFYSVPTALTKLPAQTLLKPSDWHWKPKEISLTQVIKNSEQDVAWRTIKEIYPGEVLKLGANFRLQFPVQQRDPVTIFLVRGSLALELSAIALEEGKLGQKIRVRLDTGKVFEAEILAQGQLRKELL